MHLKCFKFVNFAEQLTATRTFDVYDDNDYESYSSGTLDSILYLYFAFSLELRISLNNFTYP